MEPYMVLADKQVNGHRRGLAFSALPDAPVLAAATPGVLRRQLTSIARWGRVHLTFRDEVRRGEVRRDVVAVAADRRRRSRPSAPARSISAGVSAGCGSATRLG